MKRQLRGANSPLPHCGVAEKKKPAEKPPTTRGEFAPPSLRLYGHQAGPQHQPPTRGEFAPPSLRPNRLGRSRRRGCLYEGRIRPSLIAARVADAGCPWQLDYEGRIRPSLIAAPIRPRRRCPLRTTRGEFAPPSLRHDVRGGDVRRHQFYEGRIRPSLIAAWRTAVGSRPTQGSTRGEFAPPSLRLAGACAWAGSDGDYEGRIRPSLIAARSPSHHRVLSPTYEGRIRPSLIAAPMSG